MVWLYLIAVAVILFHGDIAMHMQSKDILYVGIQSESLILQGFEDVDDNAIIEWHRYTDVSKDRVLAIVIDNGTVNRHINKKWAARSITVDKKGTLMIPNTIVTDAGLWRRTVYYDEKCYRITQLIRVELYNCVGHHAVVGGCVTFTPFESECYESEGGVFWYHMSTHIFIDNSTRQPDMFTVHSTDGYELTLCNLTLRAFGVYEFYNGLRKRSFRLEVYPQMVMRQANIGDDIFLDHPVSAGSVLPQKWYKMNPVAGICQPLLNIEWSRVLIHDHRLMKYITPYDNTRGMMLLNIEMSDAALYIRGFPLEATTTLFQLQVFKEMTFCDHGVHVQLLNKGYSNRRYPPCHELSIPCILQTLNMTRLPEFNFTFTNPELKIFIHPVVCKDKRLFTMHDDRHVVTLPSTTTVTTAVLPVTVNQQTLMHTLAVLIMLLTIPLYLFVIWCLCVYTYNLSLWIRCINYVQCHDTKGDDVCDVLINGYKDCYGDNRVRTLFSNWGWCRYGRSWALRRNMGGYMPIINEMDDNDVTMVDEATELLIEPDTEDEERDCGNGDVEEIEEETEEDEDTEEEDGGEDEGEDKTEEDEETEVTEEEDGGEVEEETERIEDSEDNETEEDDEDTEEKVSEEDEGDGENEGCDEVEFNIISPDRIDLLLNKFLQCDCNMK